MQKKEYNSLPDSEKAKEDWVPYTYLIGWPDQNRWYYGVRYARSCKPEDLWNVYFTSSKIVKEFIKIHGDPIIKEVRKTFNNPDEARSWESRVLKKLHVVKKEEWLNKTDNRSITPLYGADNHSSKPEVKTKRVALINPRIIKNLSSNEEYNQEIAEKYFGSQCLKLSGRHPKYSVGYYSKLDYVLYLNT